MRTTDRLELLRKAKDGDLNSEWSGDKYLVDIGNNLWERFWLSDIEEHAVLYELSKIYLDEFGERAGCSFYARQKIKELSKYFPSSGKDELKYGSLEMEKQIWCSAFSVSTIHYSGRFRLARPEQEFSLFCAKYADVAVESFREVMGCGGRENLTPFKEGWLGEGK